MNIPAKGAVGSARSPISMRIVFDARSLEDQSHRGISGYAGSLLLALARLKSSLGERAALTLVGIDESRLVALASDPRLGSVSETLAWGEGLGRLARKPRFLWATLLLAGLLVGRLGKWMGLQERSPAASVGGTLVWVAPDNIDRPLVLPLGWGRTLSVFQVLHDLIPLRFPSECNRWLRLQIRMLARPHLRDVTYVAVSGLTRRSAQVRLPGLRVSQTIVGNRVSGQMVDALVDLKAADEESLWSEVSRTWPGLFASGGLIHPGEGEPHNQRPLFCLGVGRHEPYKQWSEAVAVCKSVSQRLGRDCWFLHVGPEPGQESRMWGPRLIIEGGRAEVFPNRRLVLLKGLSERELALCYRTARALVHPSLMEGYGRPLAEAYLAGLPVFARKSVGFAETSSALADVAGLHFYDDLQTEGFAPWVVSTFLAMEGHGGSSGSVSASRLGDESVQNLLHSLESLAQAFSNLLIEEQVLL